MFPAQQVQAAHRDREWWTRITEYYIGTARERSAEDLRGELSGFVDWVEFCARNREICEPALLTEFTQEFARLAANVGEGATEDRSVLVALDGVIELSRGAEPQILSRLWRAKATYFRTRLTESDERRSALDAAIGYAEAGSAEWVGAMIDLSEYHVEISRYRAALEVVDRIRAEGDLVERSPKYRCGTAMSAGVAIFTSFQDMRRAQSYFLEALADDDHGSDEEWAAWVARAMHYLARIDEIENRYELSLHRYLNGLRLQQSLPEDTNALGFVHLRLAELLAGRRLYNSAADHIDEATRLLQSGSNEASGSLQATLAEASLEALRGDPRRAEQIVDAALRRSVELGFWRGELLALGFLVALHLRGRRPLSPKFPDLDRGLAC